MNYVGNPPAPEGVILVGDTNPIGAIVWGHKVPDSSYLQLNGQVVSKTTYPDLWAHAQNFLTSDQTANPGLYRSVDGATFALPKLDGLFIRSAGSFDANRTAAALGVRQDDDFKAHTHTAFLNMWAGSGGPAHPSGSGATGATTNFLNNTGGVETRPTNVALVPCVKALKTMLMPSTVQWPPGTVGRMLQVVSHLRGDSDTVGAGTLPLDNTIPQITEGKEWFTVTITPQQAGSRIRLRLLANISNDAIGTLTGALFRAGQSNALASFWLTQRGAGDAGQVNAEAEIITADLSPITLSARFGCTTTGLHLNSNTAGPYYGGSFGSYLKAEEWGI